MAHVFSKYAFSVLANQAQGLDVVSNFFKIEAGWIISNQEKSLSGTTNLRERCDNAIRCCSLHFSSFLYISLLDVLVERISLKSRYCKLSTISLKHKERLL